MAAQWRALNGAHERFRFQAAGGARLVGARMIQAIIGRGRANGKSITVRPRRYWLALMGDPHNEQRAIGSSAFRIDAERCKHGLSVLRPGRTVEPF
jgi:hypothetical protein